MFFVLSVMRGETYEERERPLDLLSKYLLVLVFRFDAMLCFNLGRKK